MDENLNRDKMASNEAEPEVSEQFVAAITGYFEEKNGFNKSKVAFKITENSGEEIRQALALLEVPERLSPAHPDVDGAWQRFRVEAFDLKPAQTAVEAKSLGLYVSEALSAGEASRQSGLPEKTLEALRRDGTALADLKNFELADYAALAKRYGVKDTLFPRMLKWLKGLSKNLGTSSFGGAGFSSRSMVFAREDEYKQGINEEYLAEELNSKKEGQEEAESGPGEE